MDIPLILSLEPVSKDETLLLSPFDQIAPPSYVRVLMCFRLPPNSPETHICEDLKVSLHSALSRWPYLAGNVGPSSVPDKSPKKGMLEVHYQRKVPDPVSSGRAHVNIDKTMEYEALNRSGMPTNLLLPGLFLNCPSQPDLDTWPQVTYCQINLIKGGLILALSMHHSLVDGTAVAEFIRTFATDFKQRSARRKGIPKEKKASELTVVERIRSSFDGQYQSSIRLRLYHRAPELSLEEAFLKCPEYTTDLRHLPGGQSKVKPLPSTTSRIFVFTDAKLKRLKMDLCRFTDYAGNGEDWEMGGASYFSTQDCLTALLWTFAIRSRAMHLTNVQNSKLLIAVNTRKRLDPPLEPDYIGNAFVLVASELPIQVFIEEERVTISTIFKVAAAIRKSINSINAERVDHLLSLYSTPPFGKMNRTSLAYKAQWNNHGPDLYITSWANMCVGTDFGEALGSPRFVRKPWEPNEGGNIILPRCVGVGEGSWELYVQLAVDDMERMLAEEDGLVEWSDRII